LLVTKKSNRPISNRINTVATSAAGALAAGGACCPLGTSSAARQGAAAALRRGGRALQDAKEVGARRRAAGLGEAEPGGAARCQAPAPSIWCGSNRGERMARRCSSEEEARGGGEMARLIAMGGG